MTANRSLKTGNKGNLTNIILKGYRLLSIKIKKLQVIRFISHRYAYLVEDLTGMKKRVLVVENDKEILNVIAYILKDEGYEVKSMGSVNGLIEQIQVYKPDAILLDIIVPGVEGTEICKIIKTSESTKHIPVIVLSTHPKVTATIKEICADDVISKPFDISDLVDTIGKQVAA